MKNFVLCILFVLILAPALRSQTRENPGRIAGISATIQTTQFGIMVPIWLCKNVSLAPAIDFTWGQKLGSDFGIGLVPKFYFKTQKLSPYICLRGGIAKFIPSADNENAENTTDWVAGVGAGAEYFFDPMFSIGVEAQANFTKSDENSMRFNNPGNWNFNFATMVSANIYFLKKQ